MRPGRGKTALFYALLLVLPLVAIEGLTRAYFAWQVGPRIVLYGTPWFRNVQAGKGDGQGSAVRRDSVQRLGDRRGGYTKYHPNETRSVRSGDNSESYPVRINNHGFRGRDFTIEKAAGVVRVLTLGASSTFGYADRDDETYPHYLQERLDRDAPPGRRYEVINFAIPHANTGNIVAMLRAEGWALAPDVLTFYEGINDSKEAILDRAYGSGLRRVSLAVELGHHLATVLLPASVSDLSDSVAAARRSGFFENLEEIRRECAARGVRFIVVTQQAKSLMVEDARMRGLRYRDEVALVSAELEAPARRADARLPSMLPRPPGAPGNPHQFQALMASIFLVHVHLMDALRVWAATNGVELVDAMALLDDRRDWLVSWVHLHPDANRVIADALAAQILAPAALP
jgi:lysophospholipase L1-like esterase